MTSIAQEAVKIIRAPANTRPTVTSASVSATIGQDDVLVLPNQRLEIDCAAAGSPTPTVTWTKDSSSLPRGAQASSTGQLQIADFVPNRHQGTYTCTADNTVTSDRQDIDVAAPGKRFVRFLHNRRLVYALLW